LLALLAPPLACLRHCLLAALSFFYLPFLLAIHQQHSPVKKKKKEEEKGAQGEQQAEEEAEGGGGGGEGPSDHYYGCDFAFHGHRAFV
jgi:hypothetical protein